MGKLVHNSREKGDRMTAKRFEYLGLCQFVDNVEEHDLEVADKNVPKAMVFAMLVLLIVIIALGLFPDVVTSGISNYVGGLLL